MFADAPSSNFSVLCVVHDGNCPLITTLERRWAKAKTMPYLSLISKIFSGYGLPYRWVRKFPAYCRWACETCDILESGKNAVLRYSARPWSIISLWSTWKYNQQSPQLTETRNSCHLVHRAGVNAAGCLLLWSGNHTLCWSRNKAGCSHHNVEPHPTESGALESYVGLRSIKMTVLFTQLFHYALLKGTERDCLTCFSFVYLFFFIG